MFISFSVQIILFIPALVRTFSVDFRIISSNAALNISGDENLKKLSIMKVDITAARQVKKKHKSRHYLGKRNACSFNLTQMNAREMT